MAEKDIPLRIRLAEERKKKNLGFKEHLNPPCPYCGRRACKSRDNHKRKARERQDNKATVPEINKEMKT